MIFEDDNLPIMQSMDSQSVDLIYLDPPFNTYNRYPEFNDSWSSDESYLNYMSIRLREMHRLLKNTGSIYLHCDQNMSHYLKILMDKIFGRNNFQNELIWYYKNASRGKTKFAKSHDVIFWYKKGKSCVFNQNDVLSDFESGMTAWRYTAGGQSGKPIPKGKTPDDVITLPSLNAMANERCGYPTQKPLALLDLIIRASSNENDLVLDPFCGCGTTLVAAKNLNRKFIGIDNSNTAIRFAKKRLNEA